MDDEIELDEEGRYRTELAKSLEENDADNGGHTEHLLVQVDISFHLSIV